MKVLLALSCLAALVTGVPVAAQNTSENNNLVTHGEILFEQEVIKKKSYAETENEVIEALETFAAYTRAPSAEAPLDDISLQEDHLLYLNALYLYCSVNRGSCPEILDTLMEIDIVRSAFDRSPECITLKRFWKSWLQNDMQRRHQYQVRTGLLRETETFKKEQLPRYLRCTETVQQELESLGDQAAVEFLKDRYTLPSKHVEAVTDTLGSARLAQKEKINLLYATGARR